jgi:hypothetical protein
VFRPRWPSIRQLAAGRFCRAYPPPQGQTYPIIADIALASSKERELWIFFEGNLEKGQCDFFTGSASHLSVAIADIAAGAPWQCYEGG